MHGVYYKYPPALFHPQKPIQKSECYHNSRWFCTCCHRPALWGRSYHWKRYRDVVRNLQVGGAGVAKSIKDLTFRQLWRDTLRTIVGPRNFGTRGLLLTMDLWMDKYGSCCSSYTQLENASNLSRPTVNKHIDLAVEEGWMLRQKKAAKNGR